MSPIEVLKIHFVGKTITRTPRCLSRYVGSRILEVNLDRYEPVFQFSVQCPESMIENVSVLQEWNIEVA